MIAGYHQDGPRQVNMRLWNWRGLDVINAHERDPAIYVEGMRAAIDRDRSGRLDPNTSCTHHFPLERLGEALDATRDRPDGFLKAVVDARRRTRAPSPTPCPASPRMRFPRRRLDRPPPHAGDPRHAGDHDPLALQSRPTTWRDGERTGAWG